MIIGLGLPRTGTRSLYEALRILGYKGSHNCTLSGSSEYEGTDFIINNEENHYLTRGHKYILTVRDIDEWRASIGRFGYKGRDIVKHAADIIREAKEKQIEVLLYDIRYGWKPLCEFLDKKIPKEKFPNIK